MTKFRIQCGKTAENEDVFFVKISYQQTSARKSLHRAGFLYAGAESRVEPPRCVPPQAWWTTKPEIAAHFSEFADPEAKEILAPIADRMARSRATDCEEFDPSLVPPRKRPYGFQRAGVTFALGRYARGKRGVLIADEMGLGKTIQAIITANSLPSGSKILVLCPSSLLRNWCDEWRRWDTRGRTVSAVGDPNFTSRADVLVFNYDKFATAHGDALTTALMSQRWSLIVLDEAHKLKNSSSKRTRNIFGHYERGQRVSPGLIHVCERVLALTGTPIENKVKEFLPLLRALGAECVRDEADYLFRYCGAMAQKGGSFTFDGASRCEQLQDALRADVMVRRLKRQVFADMPPKIRTVIPLDCGSDAEAYRKQERQAVTDFSTLERSVSKLLDQQDTDFAKAIGSLTSKHCPFNEVARLRSALAAVKAPAVAQYIGNLLDSSGEKMIVFAHHKLLLDVLHRCFGGPSTVRIDGETSVRSRQAIVDAFQKDPKIRLALLSTRAAGVGLTLTAAPTVVFAEADWNPTWMQQAEDRAHRIGQTAEAVNVHYLIVDGTLDAHVIKTAVAKISVAERVLDSVRDPDAESILTEMGGDARKETVRQIDIGGTTVAVRDSLKADLREVGKLGESVLGDRLAALLGGETLSDRQAASAYLALSRLSDHLPADVVSRLGFQRKAERAAAFASTPAASS
jgi:SWI/SNF-related matrix-associated actin-dependent regulator 1 of chromatin subfamily A